VTNPTSLRPGSLKDTDSMVLVLRPALIRYSHSPRVEVALFCKYNKLRLALLYLQNTKDGHCTDFVTLILEKGWCISKDARSITVM
jgi:hypothetical protein